MLWYECILLTVTAETDHQGNKLWGLFSISPRVPVICKAIKQVIKNRWGSKFGIFLIRKKKPWAIYYVSKCHNHPGSLKWAWSPSHLWPPPPFSLTGCKMGKPKDFSRFAATGRDSHWERQFVQPRECKRDCRSMLWLSLLGEAWGWGAEQEACFFLSHTC